MDNRKDERFNKGEKNYGDKRSNNRFWNLYVEKGEREGWRYKISYKRIINDERIYERCGNEYKKNEKIGK